MSGITVTNINLTDKIYYKSANTTVNNSTSNQDEFEIDLPRGCWHLQYFLMMQLENGATDDHAIIGAYNDALDYTSRMMVNAPSGGGTGYFQNEMKLHDFPEGSLQYIHWLTASSETSYQICNINIFMADYDYEIGTFIRWRPQTQQAYDMIMKAGSWVKCKKVRGIYTT